MTRVVLVMVHLAFQPIFPSALLIITMVKVLVIIILARGAQITASIIFITEAIVITVVVMVNVMVKIEVEVLPVSFDCSQ